MMRFEWNALRVGDPVRLHHNGGVLESATVAFVNVLRGSNGVGIRVVADATNTVAWPSRFLVHAALGDTDDPGSPCARCAALRDTPA